MPTARIKEDGETQEAQDAQELADLNQASGGDLFGAVEEIRATSGATSTICLVTRTAPAGKTGYCGSVPVAQFTLEKLREKYL